MVANGGRNQGSGAASLMTDRTQFFPFPATFQLAQRYWPKAFCPNLREGVS
jgi:hypothetical protein